VLQKYANYVAQASDFPLTAFRGSHRDAVQAVGYGKALMFFHMLRLRLGDEVFVNGLRRFYRMNRFRQAGFGDLQRAFEEVSRLNLDHVFKQWIERVGAPRLRLTGTDVRSSAQGYRLVGTLEQVQQGNAYELSVLLVIYLADGGVVETHLPVRGRQTPLDITLSARPRRVDVDPDFDIFRLLDHKEMPPSLGQLFGAQNVLIVVPKRAPEHLRVRYRELAERWARDTRAIEWRWDDALERLPSDRSVWLFGWSSRFLPDIANAFADQALVLTDNDVRIRDRLVNRQTEAVVLVGRHPDNDAVALAWFACESPSAFAALTRKLPHYGKYSYLAFRSDDVRNVLKGQWPVIDSPLRVRLGGVAKVVPTPFQRREQRQPLTATLN
ncbi:MAG: peptidase M28, partial [Acidiferrobacterales bacterium]